MIHEPMRFMYIAASNDIPAGTVEKTIGGFTTSCFKSNPMGGFFFAPQIVDKDQTEYAGKDSELRAGTLMQLARKFDEIWLVGPDVPDEEFDLRFRMELRVAEHDGIAVRRFKGADVHGQPEPETSSSGASMRYTEHGLQISLDELRRILKYAENRVKYDNMEPCVYIKPGDHPRIIQYCCYAECNPIDHTYGAR